MSAGKKLNVGEKRDRDPALQRGKRGTRNTEHVSSSAARVARLRLAYNQGTVSFEAAVRNICMTCGLNFQADMLRVGPDEAADMMARQENGARK
jgi:hypothetical protein